MAKRKYNVNTRVRFKTDLSEGSVYYNYRGKSAVVIKLNSHGWSSGTSSVDLKLSDDKILRSVGFSVIELYDAYTREFLLQQLDELTEREQEITNAFHEERAEILNERHSINATLDMMNAYGIDQVSDSFIKAEKILIAIDSCTEKVDRIKAIADLIQ